VPDTKVYDFGEMRLLLGFYVGITAAFLSGCAIKVPMLPPPAQGQPSVVPFVGVWENTDSKRNVRKAVFEADGRLVFQGGLETYNPAQWEYDSARKELHITFPQIDPEQLQIFQLYIGSGVKSFDPKQKQVIYAITDPLGTLLLAGWEYHKAEEPLMAPSPDEPVLR